MWAVGVLVGVNLLGTGLALATLASTLNKSLDHDEVMRAAGYAPENPASSRQVVSSSDNQGRSRNICPLVHW